MIRSFGAADCITLSNAAAGTASILLCLNFVELHDPRYLWGAFALLPAAFAFDAADGFVARWRRRSSPYGGDLDSLADIVSFGVAPAVLAYTLGMRGLWDAAALIFFVACGISRLARFNVTAEALEDASTGKVAYFEGTPIPTSLALVLVLFIAWRHGAVGEDLWFSVRQLGPGRFHPLVLMFVVSGSLMVSERIRIPKP
ncbi:MAG: CDP-alcohol phosphatidyltransferase family protein [Myxococcota bacterium]|nr:CDP-alcohol phosphatidyltransferase family protein [Myxococcota bacterium]